MSLIVMKSYPNGISLHMDANAPFEDVIAEIAKKFSDARPFFKDVKVALSLEGRVLDVKQEQLIVKTIQEHSDIQIICLIGKNEESNKGIIKALKRVQDVKEEYNGRVHKGTVHAGQTLETEGSIVIIGNVEKGARVIASKDVIIIGELFGDVYAGAKGDDSCIVVALKFEPHLCKISDLVYRNREKGLFAGRNKIVPQIAQIYKGQVCLDAITKELLDTEGLIRTGNKNA